MNVYRYYAGAAVKSNADIATPRFQSLEAFRGMAAIMVVLYHSRFYAENEYVAFVRHSDIFVDLFFVLSGFVMAYSYMDKIGEKISFRKFIILRFGRLYPLHLFTLFLWLPYIAVKLLMFERGIGDTDPSESNNLLTFISNVFLLHAIDGYQPLSWNFPSWTISAEFFTYIFFFLFILFASRILSSQRKIAVSILSVAIGAYVLAWLLDGGYGLELFILECTGGFFIGIFLFLVYKKIPFPVIGVMAATALEIMAVAFLIFSVSNIQAQGFRDNLFFYISILSFAALIYLFVAQEAGHISRFLKAPVFQFIGKLSYSIYMVHAIVLAGVENLFVYLFKFDKTSFDGASNVIVLNEANYINLAILLTVIFFSALTYQYIELPWRARFRKLASEY
jgi:peptidoglycan/LPS O-acetylase OafA/YrhL